MEDDDGRARVRGSALLFPTALENQWGSLLESSILARKQGVSKVWRCRWLSFLLFFLGAGVTGGLGLHPSLRGGWGCCWAVAVGAITYHGRGGAAGLASRAERVSACRRGWWWVPGR